MPVFFVLCYCVSNNKFAFSGLFSRKISPVRKFVTIILFFAAAAAILLSSCSTSQDKWLNRNWHSMNTRYNGYYYGNMAVEEAFAELAKVNKDNYNGIIQVFQYGDKNTAQSVNPLSDRALTKGVEMIKKHSMLINGKQKNRWIDDCYFIMGKANFIKREYSSALQQFQYVMQSSEKESTKELARLWMIRTYQDMGEFGQAEGEFNNVDKNKIPKKNLWEYHASIADYFIKSGDYTPAVIPLEDLLKITRKKSKKARYTFILGQIYRNMGEISQARKYFAEAVRLKPEFELEFQAAIALAMASEGESDNDDLRKKLRRLLRDDKNIDFQDQIYYALAILDEKEKNKEQAIANYKKSVRTSTKNKEQKGLSYLALAEIYFADRNFVQAQAYYDSASLNMDKRHPRFAQVNALKENLGGIVENITIIQTQDSLQNLAKMPEKERLRKIEDYIEKLRKEDEERIARENNPNALLNAVSPTPAGGGTGKWYFYNPQMVSFGLKDFAAIWGSRKNEDNWRRKNKAVVIGSGGPMMIDPIALEQEKRDKLEATRYNPQTYLDMLPLSDSAIAASNEMIYRALYNLGLLYKQNLQAYDRAIETFEDLVKRNTENKYFPETYYQLFVLHNLTDNPKVADAYKRIILDKYPESEYAKIINDPEYLKRKETEEKGSEVFYAETFQLYKSKNYPAVIQNCETALTLYPTSDALSRFALLKALAEGATQGREAYVAALTEVETKYPGTDEALEARRILNALSSSQNAEVVGGKPFNQEPRFIKELGAPHFMIIKVPDASVDLNKTKIAISNYNSIYHSNQTIDIQEILFDTENKFLIIKTFDNAEKALLYANALDKNSQIIEDIPVEEISTFFVISNKNLGTLLQKKNLPEYMKFYFDNYKLQ
jgi:tetratricopeptide (TPR) repeat protein